MVFDKYIKASAMRLGEVLRDKPWFSSVGISEENGSPHLHHLSAERSRQRSELYPERMGRVLCANRADRQAETGGLNRGARREPGGPSTLNG
jgi:hypothetical protein